MYSLTHSLSPVLVLVVVMGSMELKIARLFSCSFSDSLSSLRATHLLPLRVATAEHFKACGIPMFHAGVLPSARPSVSGWTLTLLHLEFLIQ